MKRTSFGSLKRLFACLSVPREVVSCLLPGSLDLSFQKFALGHDMRGCGCLRPDSAQLWRVCAVNF